MSAPVYVYGSQAHPEVATEPPNPRPYTGRAVAGWRVFGFEADRDRYLKPWNRGDGVMIVAAITDPDDLAALAIVDAEIARLEARLAHERESRRAHLREAAARGERVRLDPETYAKAREIRWCSCGRQPPHVAHEGLTSRLIPPSRKPTRAELARAPKPRNGAR